MHDTTKGWKGDVSTELTPAPQQKSSQPTELHVHMHEEHALQPVARRVIPARGPVRSLVPRRHKHWVSPATNSPGASNQAYQHAPAHIKMSSFSAQGVSKVASRSGPSPPVARSTRRGAYTAGAASTGDKANIAHVSSTAHHGARTTRERRTGHRQPTTQVQRPQRPNTRQLRSAGHNTDSDTDYSEDSDSSHDASDCTLQKEEQALGRSHRGKATDSDPTRTPIAQTPQTARKESTSPNTVTSPRSAAALAAAAAAVDADAVAATWVRASQLAFGASASTAPAKSVVKSGAGSTPSIEQNRGAAADKFLSQHPQACTPDQRGAPTTETSAREAARSAGTGPDSTTGTPSEISKLLKGEEGNLDYDVATGQARAAPVATADIFHATAVSVSDGINLAGASAETNTADGALSDGNADVVEAVVDAVTSAVFSDSEGAPLGRENTAPAVDVFIDHDENHMVPQGALTQDTREGGGGDAGGTEVDTPFVEVDAGDDVAAGAAEHDGEELRVRAREVSLRSCEGVQGGCAVAPEVPRRSKRGRGNVTSEKLFCENVPPGNVPSENVPSGNSPSENVTSDNVPSENVPSENVPPQDSLPVVTKSEALAPQQPNTGTHACVHVFGDNDMHEPPVHDTSTDIPATIAGDPSAHPPAAPADSEQFSAQEEENKGDQVNMHEEHVSSDLRTSPENCAGRAPTVDASVAVGVPSKARSRWERRLQERSVVGARAPDPMRKQTRALSP